MFWRILGKDMKKRKSINIILFLFITLASVFLSSSANNIMVVSSAVGYYMDYANIADVSIVVMGTEEMEAIHAWLEESAPKIKKYEIDTLAIMKESDIRVKRNGKNDAFDSKNANVYLGKISKEFSKVFDVNGETFTLKPGEIAVSRNILENNGLEVGDSIICQSGSLKKEFVIRLIIKDAAFGNEMSGMTRFIISDSDFAQFEAMEEAELFLLYSIDTEDVAKFTQEVSEQGFSSLANVITKDTYLLVWSFDMVVAALLILIGICLILIAMLVLRFTLVFTMEEDYREIGIMKAIGLKGFVIKKIYLVKYLFLVVSGAVLGFFLSIPVSRAMVKGVATNMIMEDSSANLWINVICTIFIIFIVLLFCYKCTKRMDKISAIAAIRGGQTGERYSRKAGIALHRRNRLPVVFFLGFNDIISRIRRYLILILTFCISCILITIPLNTVNTMRSREMAEKFGINPDSAVYVSDIEQQGESYRNTELLQDAMKRVEQEMKEKGYDAKLTATAILFLQYREKGSKRQNNIMTIQPVGRHTDFLTYDEGTAPILENEIAFSKQILDLYGWKIGDYVEASIGGETKRFIITGTYTDYMQMGQSARLNSEFECGKEQMYDYWSIMVDMDTELTQKELSEELQRQFPDYNWSDAQEIVDINVGSIQETMDEMLIPMTAMLCFLIMLITLLMEKLFIVREKGEIAMMKSVGYKNRDICLWQVIRMVYVALLSMVAAVPISFISNRWILRPVFGIMGADVAIQVVPWKVYGVYPAILLSAIIAATVFAARSIRKISIQEMNNME